MRLLLNFLIMLSLGLPAAANASCMDLLANKIRNAWNSRTRLDARATFIKDLERYQRNPRSNHDLLIRFPGQNGWIHSFAEYHSHDIDGKGTITVEHQNELLVLPLSNVFMAKRWGLFVPFTTFVFRTDEYGVRRKHWVNGFSANGLLLASAYISADSDGFQVFPASEAEIAPPNPN